MTDDVSEVPIWPAFVKPVLEVLSGGETLPRRELVKRALDAAGVSAEGRAEFLTSGGSRAEGRVGFAISDLTKANWIERPKRASYRITSGGREFLAAHPEGTPDYATARRVFAPFQPPRATRTVSVPRGHSGATLVRRRRDRRGLLRVGLLTRPNSYRSINRWSSTHCLNSPALNGKR